MKSPSCTGIYDKLGLFGGLTVVGSAPLVTLDIINFQGTFNSGYFLTHCALRHNVSSPRGMSSPTNNNQWTFNEFVL